MNLFEIVIYFTVATLVMSGAISVLFQFIDSTQTLDATLSTAFESLLSSYAN